MFNKEGLWHIAQTIPRHHIITYNQLGHCQMAPRRAGADGAPSGSQQSNGGGGGANASLDASSRQQTTNEHPGSLQMDTKAEFERVNAYLVSEGTGGSMSQPRAIVRSGCPAQRAASDRPSSPRPPRNSTTGHTAIRRPPYSSTRQLSGTPIERQRTYAEQRRGEPAARWGTAS